MLQVGADRLRSAPRSALRSNPGYTQRRHPRSRHLALSTLGHGAPASPPREAGSAQPSLPWLGAVALPPGVYVTPSPTYTHLQVVQRSLSGGYLTADAALLNANARSK